MGEVWLELHQTETGQEEEQLLSDQQWPEWGSVTFESVVGNNKNM